ncbi:MAG: ATP-binding protein, partial [Candidatus Dormibacteraeota bacterium]|nr:ATP-binding protein [Candidatus Dormibacteraeota bacterium]
MPATTAPTPLVGREDAVNRLWAAVEASTDGGMRTVVVRGPAGIGKTRVLDEFAVRARGAGTAVIAGRAPAVGGFAFGALADALG